MLSPTFSSVLAIVVALASLFLFLISFMAPRLYRAQDLWWSGVGVFYALVLWFCSAQIRGAVLLGTIASVSLLGWLSTQVYLSRWAALTDAEKGGGTLKQFQALGQIVTRLLESRPAQPSDTPSEVAPEVSSAKPRRSTPSGKVRWVRPEKTKPSEGAESQAESETIADASIVSPDSPVTEGLDGSVVSPDPSQPPQNPEIQEIAANTLSKAAELITLAEPPIESQPETPEQEGTEAWDEMEADLDTEAESSPDYPSIDPPIPSETTKTSLIQRIQNFFQGRKSHGKRFVRPDDETPGVTAKPGSKSPETDGSVDSFQTKDLSPTPELPEETIESIEETLEAASPEPESPETLESIEETLEAASPEPESPEAIKSIEETPEPVSSEPEPSETIEPIEETRAEPASPEPESPETIESIEETPEPVSSELEPSETIESIEETRAEPASPEPESSETIESIEETPEPVSSEPEPSETIESIEETPEPVSSELEPSETIEPIEETPEPVSSELEPSETIESIEETLAEPASPEPESPETIESSVESEVQKH